jgi:hypothetical protein
VTVRRSTLKVFQSEGPRVKAAGHLFYRHALPLRCALNVIDFCRGLPGSSGHVCHVSNNRSNLRWLLRLNILIEHLRELLRGLDWGSGCNNSRGTIGF